MQINEHNYGAYILDYFEGTLSALQREELLLFLNAHPEFRKEFEEYEHISLVPEEKLIHEEKVFFEEKNALKKNISVSDEEFFDYAEGNLNNGEKNNIQKIVNGNQKLEREFALWQNTKAEADLSIVYPSKEKLKRRPVVVALWKNVYMRAAAVIAMALGAGWIYLSSGENGNSNNIFAFAGKSSVEKSVAVKFMKESKDSFQNGTILPVNPASNNNNLAVNASFKIRNRKRSPDNFILPNDTSKNIRIATFINKDSSDQKFIIKNDFPQDQLVKSIRNDSLTKKVIAGIWEPEEILPPASKKGFKRKFLDVAVSCLNGLKKIGVKKADGIKKEDPQNGVTDYTLVLGKRSYSISQ